MLDLHGTTYPLRKLLFWLGTLALLVLVSLYVLYQGRLILTGPEITLIDPPPIVQHDRVVDLSGRAQNITKITLNGREIYTDENGYFKEAVVLENGYTIATLEATDRYGRMTSVVTPFVFTPMSRLNND